MTPSPLNPVKLMLVAVPEKSGFYKIDRDSVVWFDPDINAFFGSWQSLKLKEKINGDILGCFHPSSNSIDFEYPDITVEILMDVAKKMWPLKSQDKFSDAVDVNITDKQQQHQIKQWRESKDKIMPSKILVIKLV